MEGFDTSTDNLANLFVKKFYNITADGENINVQNDVANCMNILANPNPIVRNVTLRTYRALIAEATRQMDALRDNNVAFNPIIDHLQNFYNDGIANGLWDEFGPAPPPPELRRAGGSKKKKKKKRKTRRRYF